MVRVVERTVVNRRTFIACGIVAGAVGRARLARADKPTLARYSFQQVRMGVPWELVLYAESEQAANRASQAAFDRVAQLDQCLSDYRLESELSRLNATAGTGRATPVSDDLWQVITAAQDLSARTDGAFDMTVGPVVRLWRRARRYKQLPSPESLAEARQAVGYQLIKLDPKPKTVELTRTGMRLDPGGIAMGYAADEALKVLRGAGISRAMIDASGDIVCGDAPPDRAGWIVGIAPAGGKQGRPTCYLSLANAAVTTSGDAYQFVEIDGVRYSHIVDPKTGLGLTTRCTATVVAATGIAADSIATAVSVLGPEKGAALVERSPGVAAHIACLAGDCEKVTETSRLAAWEVSRKGRREGETE